MPPPSKSNMHSEQNPRSSRGAKDGDEDETPSHNLWVGNLASDISDEDLMDVFAKYGALDSVTTYSSRSYAFVYFKRLEDAKAAKDALQGTVIRGNPIKIEFARPAKPGKHLWVGGIGPSIAKEQLEDEFLKFGKIEDFKFLPDRNSALVDYYRLEDAAAALKNMNGKRLGGEQIRVDYLRSQPLRRQENWSDFHESRDGHLNNRRGMGTGEPLWMPPDSARNFPEASQFGLKRHMPPQPVGGRRGEGQPSNILWIGYPPSVQIDEQMLHNAMILFGEIERIKSFPSRHYSFVEFRSIDEARRAKEGLQGRLFNDPRIQILFSSSELAPGKESPVFYPGIKGPRPEMFFNEPPFGLGPVDFSHSRPMAPSNFTGPLPPNAMAGNMMMRPFGPQGVFDPLISAAELNDLAGRNNFPDANLNNPMGPNWRRLSPSAPGMVSSPSSGMRPPIGSMPNTWDGFDNQFQRESKRSRIDGPSTIDDAPFPLRKMDNQGIMGEQLYGYGPQHDRGASGPFAGAHGQGRHSPGGSRVSSGGPTGQGIPDNDYCWRGVIAKGGTPVCHARCVPIGKGIEAQLPQVVNCSARTGLDMLTKHYAEANGFDIAFFLPDSEDDFASYTEFLRYLGAKNRAGVAKFEDGTTLFLVPPSDFLTKVLNVSGPERLYGVVLKLPQHIPSSASVQQQQPQYIDRQQLPSLQTDYGLISQKEDSVYNRAMHEESMHQTQKLLLPPSDESHSLQSVPQDYANNPAAPPQAGVSLTPELIATLAALIPGNMQSSTPSSGQLSLGSSSVRPSFPASVTPDKVTSSLGWRQEHQGIASSSLQHLRDDQAGHPSQQLGHQMNTQAPVLSQFQAYTGLSHADHSAQTPLSGVQIQDPSFNLSQHGSSARPLNTFVMPSQSGQFTVPQQANQQYQLENSQSAQNGYAMVTTSDATGLLHSPAFQQNKSPVTSSTQVQGLQGVNLSQSGTQLGADKLNAELPNQVQQLQTALASAGASAGQGTSEGEVDKNQRYQSTLQFAASLLLQIQQQQQQQQTNAQAMQGAGNQQ